MRRMNISMNFTNVTWVTILFYELRAQRKLVINFDELHSRQYSQDLIRYTEPPKKVRVGQQHL